MSTIVEIENYLISSEIFTEQFSCDYEKCKGACCIIGDSGAPLSIKEGEILDSIDFSKLKHISKDGLSSLKELGPFVIDSDGDQVTPLVDNKECAYSYFDDADNCMCALEKSFEEGIINFRKPSSCSLYPIRVTNLSNGMIALNLHRWQICKDAYIKGKNEQVPVFRFLKNSLIENYGADFYNKLEDAFENIFKKELRLP